MRVVTLLLLFSWLTLLLSLLLGGSGFFESMTLQKRIQSQRESNARLLQENAALEHLKEALVSDPGSMEGYIRREYGFIRKGERFIVLNPTDAASASTPAGL